MIDKIRLKRNIIIFMLVIAIGLGVYAIVSTLARYTSSSEDSNIIGIAFWFANATHKEGKILVNDVYPRTEYFEYPFTVTNSNGRSTADTDLDYVITLTATTNLPLNYYLYKKVDTVETEVAQSEYYTDENENIYRKMPETHVNEPSLSSNYDRLTTDTDGTYYKEYVYFLGYDQNRLIMEHNVATTDNYLILVEFPETYSEIYTYQDLVDFIKLNIEAKQIIN